MRAQPCFARSDFQSKPKVNASIWLVLVLVLVPELYMLSAHADFAFASFLIYCEV